MPHLELSQVGQLSSLGFGAWDGPDYCVPTHEKLVAEAARCLAAGGQEKAASHPACQLARRYRVDQEACVKMGAVEHAATQITKMPAWKWALAAAALAGGIYLAVKLAGSSKG